MGSRSITNPPAGFKMPGTDFKKIDCSARLSTPKTKLVPRHYRTRESPPESQRKIGRTWMIQRVREADQNGMMGREERAGRSHLIAKMGPERDGLGGVRSGIGVWRIGVYSRLYSWNIRLSLCGIEHLAGVVLSPLSCSAGCCRGPGSHFAAILRPRVALVRVSPSMVPPRVSRW